MHGLREIAFTEEYGYHPPDVVRIQTYNNLAKLLASCPAGQITKLSVMLTSLHQIFQFLTPEVEPLRLKDLRMTQSLIKLDALTIPHLRHLTCLHLLSMEIPSNRKEKDPDISDDMNSESSRDLEKAEDCIGSKMSDVWSALHRAEIYLKEIAVTDINTGLLGYLTHYTGLTKLAIFSGRSSLESDASASLFFTAPLASHVKTLEELDLRASFDDLWCLGEHNISAISSCTGLKRLRVCVSRADLPKSKSLGDSESEVETAQQPDRSSSGNSEVAMTQNQPNIIVRSLVRSFEAVLV